MKRWTQFVSLLAVVALILTACAAPTPEVIEKEVIVEKEVPVTVEVEKEVVVEKKVVETVVVEKEVVVEAPKGPKPTIKYQMASWQTHWILTTIEAFITEHGLGYPVEIIETDTPVMQAALPIGDVHVNTECWRMNVMEWYNEEIANGRMLDLGAVFESSTQGWYIPRYTAEEYDIWTIEDLLDPEVAQLFQDPEDPSKGVWTNCIAGWFCSKVQRVKSEAYGLDEYYNVLTPGAAAGIDANIAGAVERGEPVLSYYWEPTWILGKYDMVKIEEPEYSDELWDAISEAAAMDPIGTVEEACSYQTWDIHILAWSGLLDIAPDVVAMLSKMFVGTANVQAISAWMEDNDATPEETAIYYLQNYENQWTTWVSPEAAAKVKAALP
jgi:glycine betaine/proline transport system substrate-binding protein